MKKIIVYLIFIMGFIILKSMDQGPTDTEQNISSPELLLIKAIFEGSLPMAKEALKKNANPSKVFEDPSVFEGEESLKTPLDYLSYKKHFSVNKEPYNEILKLIAQERNYSPQQNLLVGTEIGNLKMVQSAIQAGADINHKAPKEALTPLVSAAFYLQPKIVEYLLKQEKIDVNRKDAFGYTPLIVISGKKAKGQQYQVNTIAQLLLNQANIKLDEVDIQNLTALDHAIAGHNYSIAKAIINKKLRNTINSEHGSVAKALVNKEFLKLLNNSLVDAVEKLPYLDNTTAEQLAQFIKYLIYMGAQPGKIKLLNPDELEEQISIQDYLTKLGKANLVGLLFPTT